MVQAHGTDQAFRKTPPGQKNSAQGGVIETEDIAFGQAQQHVLAAGQPQGPARRPGEVPVEDHPAHVMQQSGHEKTLHSLLAAVSPAGQGRSRQTAGHAMLPHGFDIDEPGGQVLEKGHHGNAQGQGGKLAAAHDGHGPGEGVHLGREPVKRAVHQLQKPGGQALVHADDPGGVACGA
jgi:hypothetical protein